MVKKLHFCFFLLLVLFSIDHYAQSYTITGKVFDAESKEPLPFVPVLIKGTTVGGTTDFDGNYTLSTDKLVDSLVFTYIGYDRLAIKIKKGFPVLESLLKCI